MGNKETVPFRQKLRTGAQLSKDLFRVAPQMQILGLAAIGITDSFGEQAVNSFSEGKIIEGVASTIATLATARLVVSAEYNSAEALLRYKRVRKFFEKYGWNDSAANLFSKKWCDRYALRKAAIDTGNKKEVQIYMKKNNLPWYKLP